MILERKAQIKTSDFEQEIKGLQEKFKTDIHDEPRIYLVEFAGLMHMYSGAMKEVSTKLEVLDDEFHIRHSHNPIHHLECRIKNIKSIYEKMQRYGVPLTPDSLREHVQDIAGIRVICNFIDDIYEMEKLLLRQSDITLVKRRDYIEQPKENGYRSLHLVVKVPVFLSDKIEDVPVEIQLRTIAMDYWASLEHMLQYKKTKSDIDTKKYAEMLLDCASTLAATEKTMQQIRIHIEQSEQ